MTGRARTRGKVIIPVLLACAAAWMLLLFNPELMMMHAHPSPDSAASIDMLLAINSLSSLALGWTLMMVAMMSPSLIAPVLHVLERSFKRRWARVVIFFVVGYAAIWLAAGSVLLAVVLVLNLLRPPYSYLWATAAGLIAVIWQCSPLKQSCLNRSQNHRALAAFGITADLDIFRFGITHGLWCVGSCWALMLYPLILSQGHFAAMAIATLVITSERLEQPMPLAWSLRVPGKLMRIAIAQSSIRMQYLFSGFRTLPPAEAGS